MKLEELQKAWKSLNDKVIQNEIIHPEEIMEVLANRKESNLKKIQRLEKTIWVLIALVNIVVIYLFTFSQSPIPLSIRIGAFIITLSALFMQSCVLKSIKRIATETNLEKQIQHILRYRLLYNRINIISYASIILFFAISLHYYGTLLNYILIGAMLLVSCILDYFIFQFTQDKIRDMLCINKELAELNATKDE